MAGTPSSPAAGTRRRSGLGAAPAAARLPRRPSAAVAARRRDRLFLVALGAGLAAGVVVRVAMVASNWAALDSDEAVVGLMARAIARGELPTFFWGQQYGGPTEAFVLAAVGSVIGWSTLTIRLVAAALSATAAALVWRIGRRTIGPWPGAAAAVLFWIWPAAYVYWSLKLRGFYWTAVVAGLVVVLCALRLAEGPNRRDAAVFGLAAGIGWWSTPQIALFLVPVGLWLAARHRQALRPLLVYGGPAAVVGALPWLVYNLRHSFVALNPPELAAGAAGSYIDHLGSFFGTALPMAAGARVAWVEAWIPGGPWLYAAVLVAVAALVAWRRPPLLPVVLVAFPLLHALSPWSSYVGDGRYLVYLAPFLALAVAGAVRHRAALAVVAAGLLAVTLVGLDRADGYYAPWSGDGRVPENLAPVVAELDRLGIRYVYADYWVGYRLAYETGERIVPEGFRNARWSAQVDRALDDVAYVYLRTDPMADQVRAEMARIGQTWTERGVAEFRFLIPER